MTKKIILIFLIICSFAFGFWYYNSHKTIECWWGTLYPSLCFIPLEDNSEITKGEISSTDEHYIYVDNEPIKIKVAFLEWIKKYF